MTSHRTVEDPLRESEIRYRRLFEAARDGILILDTETLKITDVNPFMKEFLGYSHAEFLGKELWEIGFFRDKEASKAAFRELQDEGYLRYDDLPLKTKAGEPRQVEFVSNVYDEAGHSVIQCNIRDITERKILEDAQSRIEERYRALFEYSTDGIIISSPEKYYLDANASMCQMLGYSPAELIGLHASDIVATSETQHIDDAFFEIQENSDYHREWQFRRKDGSIFVGDVMVTMMPDSNVMAVIRDVTELKRTEKERRIMSEIIQGVVSTPYLEDYLDLVHRSIRKIMYAENCFVMLYDPEADMVSFEFWADSRDARPEPKRQGTGFASYVLRTGVPLRMTREFRRKLEEQREAVQIGSVSASWIGVPLRTNEGTIGVLVLQHYSDEDAYSQGDLEFLTSVGNQIGLAIERKRAVQSLEESEERYRSVVETAPDVIITIDESSIIKFINAAAVGVFGYELSEVRGKSLTILMPEYLRDLHQAGLERYQRTGQKHVSWAYVELTGLHKSGREIPITLSFSEFTQNGRRFFTGIIRDISERRQAIEALRKSEERYRELVENAIDIIYTHDLDGDYTSFNKAGEAITGYTREESLTMNMAEIVAPESLVKAKEMIAGKPGGTNETVYELVIIAKDGRRVNVEVNTRIVYDNDIPVGVQGTARDITESKRTEEALRVTEDQLRQATKMEAIGLLAGGIAHDFNNLLTAINGYSDLTLRKMWDDDPFRPNIEAIKGAGDRAAALTGQLLAFSRKKVLQPIVHNLNPLITATEKMLRRIVRENVELRAVLDPNLGNINADPGQIEQVIMNLAVNARDAMPNGGTLTIETENVFLDEDYASRHLGVSPGKFVRMTVTDTGEGMSKETQQHIFEPFFTTKEMGKGTGLGLSTVFGIVKQSGGEVTVYSEIGHGTTFKIYLPCVDEVVEIPNWKHDEKVDNSGSETILLVEDEEIVRDLVHEVLSSGGYKVLVAANGKAAITICESYLEPIHMLLSDVIMPGMSGGELKEQVIKILPDIKILFMSGYTDDSIANRGIFGLGAEFIEKPFTPDGLMRKVRNLMDT